jgi:nucleoside-diphosphate-sugar epimerase
MLEHVRPTPRPPDRVVVIGAGGFVGRAIVRRLAVDGVPSLPLTRRELDLLAPSAGSTLRGLIRDTDSVVFVSALAPVRAVPMLAPNITMAEAVCAALADRPDVHVVYVSSDAVYSDDGGLVTESSACAPSTLHGVMHAAREAMLRATVKAPLAILRPTLLYGADDPHNGYGPNRFRRQAASGEAIALFGAGEEMRDHVFVDDVGVLTARVLASRSRGVLNVATGVSTSFRRVAELVAALAPKPIRIETSPRQTPITHRHFDVAACLKAFPTFRYTGLDEGLRRANGGA